MATWEERSENASRAARASHKARQQAQAQTIRWLEEHGRQVTLPSGRMAHVHGSAAAILGGLVRRQPSGRVKAYELAGARVALDRADRAALDGILERKAKT